MLSRANNLAQVRQQASENKAWDLIVIGGGATGLGAAVDAASRGLKVLLLEAHDFAKGTSSRATKLAHGGVRYLAQGNVSLVREALEERGRMLRNAPNLVKPLAFVIPAYRWFDRFFYWIGLKMYDLLAGKLSVGPTTLMKLNQVLSTVPTVKAKGLRGGVRYFDAQFDDARLAVALMKTLHTLGGTALNYMPVTGLVKVNDRVQGVNARCSLSGETLTLHAKAVINATGVWVDDVRRLDNPKVEGMLSPSQGVHVVVDRKFYPSEEALLVPKTEDGRVLFVVPWLGKTLIGTTDTARQDAPLEPKPLDGEIDFVLKTAGQYLQTPPTREDVRSVFVGLRPLVKQSNTASTKSISREHTIVTDPSGLVTITGGKWTTYRSMAEEVVDLVCRQYRLTAKPSGTRNLRLEDGLPNSQGHLTLNTQLSLTLQDIHTAVKEEMAVTVEDVLARRNRALFLDSQAALQCMDYAADVLKAHLNLSDEDIDRQKQEFAALSKQYGV